MKTLAIQRAWCKGCGICVAFCPKEVLALDQEGKAYAKAPEKCIYCRLCEYRCPDLAIQVLEESDAADAAAQPACGCSGTTAKKKKAKGGI